MVVLWVLGALDLLAAAGMLLLHFDLIGARLGIGFAVYLAGKALAFPKDFASFGDFITALYILAMAVFGLHTLFVYVLAVWLLQKSVLSFLAR
ncbi:hypothetical protein HYX10_05125 [Candidatus Woesearchaeota archaeon]|nr:hypothetical protein [Candidatus Woesearchaeota archaeon]